MEVLYTMESALDATKQGDLEGWIHRYLLGEGRNEGFSRGLKLAPRSYLGPVWMPLDWLVRCCGPEDNMQFKVDAEHFEVRVGNLMGVFEADPSVPPLIVNYCDGAFTLSDGNHRYEALVRLGVERFPVIIWTTGTDDMEDFKARYQESCPPLV